MKIAASELLRALRGERSQVAFARRLGYRANPITDWERGERFPTGEETLRAAAKVGIDVLAAFGRFAPLAPIERRGGFALGSWLDRLRGTTSLSELASRCGLSRYSISRWLRGQAKPRLPDLLTLIDAMTGRAPHWVAELVDIERVPSLTLRFRIAEAARRAALELPWTEAVLRVLETRAFEQPDDMEARVAETLGISLAEARSCLETLLQAGAVVSISGRYVVKPVSVDTRGGAGALHRVKQHWSAVASERLSTPTEQELFAYNVMSVSRADLALIREKLRMTFREIRTLVASSQPEEVVAVVNLQLLAFDPEATPAPPLPEAP